MSSLSLSLFPSTHHHHVSLSPLFPYVSREFFHLCCHLHTAFSLTRNYEYTWQKQITWDRKVEEEEESAEQEFNDLWCNLTLPSLPLVLHDKEWISCVGLTSLCVVSSLQHFVSYLTPVLVIVQEADDDYTDFWVHVVLCYVDKKMRNTMTSQTTKAMFAAPGIQRTRKANRPCLIRNDKQTNQSFEISHNLWDFPWGENKV